MCLACGMNDEDAELWAAYQDYLDKRGLAGFELTPMPPGPAAEAAPPTPTSTPRPAPSTFTCDET
jgi:hypothetical protein